MKIFIILFVTIISHQLTQAHRFNNNWWSPIRNPKHSQAQQAFNQNDNLSSESLDVSKWLPMIPQNDEAELHHHEPEFELPQNENNLENQDNNLSDIQSSYLGIDWNQNGPTYRPSNGHQSYEERNFENKHTFGYDHSISHHSEVHWDDKEEYPRPNLGQTLRPTLQPTLEPTIRTTSRPLSRSSLRTTLPSTLRPTVRSTLNPATRTTTRTTTRSITRTTLRPTTVVSSTFKPTTSSVYTFQPITTTYRPPLPTRFEEIILPNVTTTIRPVRHKKVKNWLDMSTVIKPTTYRHDLTTTLSPLNYHTERVTERTTQRVTIKPTGSNKRRRKKLVKNLETTEPLTTEWSKNSDGLIDDNIEGSTVAMDSEKLVINNNQDGNNLSKRRRKKPRNYKKVSLDIDSSTLQPTQGFNLEQLEPLEGGQGLNKKWQGLQEDEVKQITGSPLLQKKKGLLREDEIVEDLKAIFTNRAKIEPLKENLEPIHQENLDLDNIGDDNDGNNDNLLMEDPKMKLKKRQSLLEKEVKDETELESARLEDSIPGTPGRDYSIYYEIPKTTFRCSDQPFPGYYGDVQFKCQVFHLCQEDGRQDTFICPVGTIFNQATFVCDWWFNVNCDDSSQFFGLNEHIYEPERISSERSSGLIAKREYLLEDEEADRVDLKPEPIESKNQQVYFDEEIQNTKPVYVKTKLAQM